MSTDGSFCPLTYMLSVAGGKWKLFILGILARDRVRRYGELKKNMPSITHKMLSQQLKELENDQLIDRREYYEVPPKVEYSLTEKGRSLIPILEMMIEWGNQNRPA